MNDYRRRFEALVTELRSTRGIVVSRAEIAPPTPSAELRAAQHVARAAWPDGMDALYTELGSVDIDWTFAGNGGGAIHIPRVGDVWDHAAHEDELWFDWLVEEDPDHPFTKIRPIDRFVPEAYAVLYPVPPNAPATAPATVHYHYCGESLVPTDLTYAVWLEHLLHARGTLYWLTLATAAKGPTATTWVEQNIDRAASVFPDFVPDAIRLKRSPRPIVD